VRLRALAAAIRGPLPRLPVTRWRLYEDLCHRGVEPEAAALVALAFGITETEADAALSRACRRLVRSERVREKREQLVEAGVREELAEQIAEGLVDPVKRDA
jgi:hypothetical protein